MKRSFLLTCVFLLAALQAACAVGPSPLATATAVESAATQPLPSATALTPPTSTPAPGKVLLVSAAGIDPAPYRAVLSELAAPAGLSVETLSDLQPGALTPEVRVVVLAGVPGNLNELLAAAPGAQFVAISGVDLAPVGNLSVIRYKPEDQAFLAGFISALLSDDWRAAGLLPGDGPLGAGLQDAFVNGGRYFCGVCAPGWPLGMVYPQASVLPAAGDGPSWQAAAADLFDNKKADMFYIAPEAARPEVFAYLAGKDQFGVPVRLVGAQPPPAEVKGQWIATVTFDSPSALRQAWPDLLAGKGGASFQAGLSLEDVDRSFAASGRMRLVEELMAEIAAGRVYPFTVSPQ